MVHLPRMQILFWKTLAKPDAPGGKVDMFYFDDPKGDTQMSFAVEHGRGDLAAEVGKRVNDYPLLIGLIGRMANELEIGGCAPKQRAAMIQEARDYLGIS